MSKVYEEFRPIQDARYKSDFDQLVEKTIKHKKNTNMVGPREQVIVAGAFRLSVVAFIWDCREMLKLS